MNELVQICDLTKVYERKKVAVNHMNLMIPSGRIVGLLGPNGSGKTTLMNMISGIYFPDEPSSVLDLSGTGVCHDWG